MEYFRLALDLAAQAAALSNPNPRVGCVIVAADGRVLGQGHTRQRGGPHAEVVALRDAVARRCDVAGSTVYVTLEPCAHHGRTPPCCDALIAARVSKVCVALPDPNPLVAGQGLARLRAAGVAVEMAPPQVAQAAWEQNIGFFSRMLRQRPWVRLKTAASLDGVTALANGDSQWITGEAARTDVQHWRARACAVLTGVGTVLADDPLLNVRLPGLQRQPHLVVLDTRLRTPPSARLLGVPQRQVWIATVEQRDAGWQQRRCALQQAGAACMLLPTDAAGSPDLHALLGELARREVNELHIEAGARLNGAWLQAGLADELLAYIAPKLLGPGRPLADLPALQRVSAAAAWQMRTLQRIGDDVRLQMTQGNFWQREPLPVEGIQIVTRT